MNYNSKTIFTSKANVLKFLNNNIKKSKIEHLFFFTINEWKNNQNLILKKIQLIFNASDKIIIRSSAFGEDSVENSFAGIYDSILDISPKSIHEIKNGIEYVQESYAKNGNVNTNNQILIQNQTTNITSGGVIFTKTPDTGSPYYIINFEDGGTTTKTTHGLSNKIIKIHRNVKISKLDKRWKSLITSVKELEILCNSNTLDIEFGITNSLQVVIFQVRPLTSINKTYDKNFSKNISNQIKQNQIKFLKSIKKRKITSKNFILSDMTDWNPAEIIGNNPNNLSYSLYSYLITDNVWSKSRKILGYHDVGKTKLMMRFGNKPYIDVNASFNSLIPQNFSKQLTKKLLNFFSLKLKENPHLHDKVEFEILFTCYDFMIDKRLDELKKYGFSTKEISQIKENLHDFTKNILLNGETIISNCQNQLEIMIQSRTEIVKKLDNSKVIHKDKIILLKQLLDDCKDFGTTSFAIMARLSFIGTILLKSFQEFSKSEFIFDNFLYTLSTPLTEIQNDFVDYKNKKISKYNFLKKYGHLRPGTYDITNLPYSENDTFLSEINFTKKIKHKKLNFDDKEISKLLLKELNITSSLSIMDFISTVIIQREKFKFEFTKNLSLILELIASIGKSSKFSRDEISNLDIITILKSKNLKKSKIIIEWKNKINSQKTIKLINNNLILPQLITSNDDFEIINYHTSKPNYITTKIIKNSILELNTNTKLSLIENSILLIENADPGYDWIFSKNPAGLITKYGGVASHMSIRCAEIGLPAAIGCGELLFEKLKSSMKIQLDCKNQQIFVLEHKKSDDYIEERKILKSLGYIK